MVAFNFTKAFVDKVASGEKSATMRPTKRAKVGDTLQLYTGLRTRHTKLIKLAKCTDVREVTVYNDRIEGLDELDESEFLELMGSADESMDDFIGYFRKHCDLPYTCYMYIWTDKVEPKRTIKNPSVLFNGS